MRILSIKHHTIGSGIVWGFFFDENFQSFVRFHQNADHSVGKEGTQRARLVLGGACGLPSADNHDLV